MMTRPATVADGARLLAQMTPERRAGFSVQGFADHLRASRYTWAGIDLDETVVAIGGVMDSGAAGIGYAWQVIDPAAVARTKRAYLRQGRAVLALAHRLYPHLSVCIEPHNAPARRHAQRLGWVFAGATVVPGGEWVWVFERSAVAV